eukprot:7265307-Ditylum_brightwellii.AAC.1
MDIPTHEVRNSTLCYAGQGDMSHIGGVGSVLENEESTQYEGTDEDNDASVSLPDDAALATVIGYTYGLRSLGTVMPEVSGHFQKKFKP